MRQFKCALGLAVGGLAMAVASAQVPAGTSFTYQGRLENNGVPANGLHDFSFGLYDAAVGGAVIATDCVDHVNVVDGVFTVEIDFGVGAFSGDARWLAIGARANPTPGDCNLGLYVLLTPRQSMTAAPYAQYALNGPWEDVGTAITNTNTGFVGVNRTSTVTGAEWFGIQAPTSGTAYGGMYIRTDSDQARPFYGYKCGAAGSTGWTYLDGATGDYRIYVDGDRVTVTNSGFVGVNRTSSVTSAEYFGIQAPVTGTSYGGMYIRTDSEQGRPFYGYKCGVTGNTAWTYVDGTSGDLRINVDGDRVTVTETGNVGIGTTAPASGLQVANGNLTFKSTGGISTGLAEIRTAGDIEFNKNIDETTNDGSWFRWYTDGDTIETMRISAGNEAAILGDGTFTSNGIDYAEAFKTADANLEAGEVVSLAVGDWESCRRTTGAYEAHIIGVVSTQPGFLTGMSFNAENAANAAICAERDAARAVGDKALERELTAKLGEIVKQTHRPIALLGRVPCRVDGSNGPIKAGDRLTSSSLAGHAMKQTQTGQSIGFALEDWTAETPGMVMVMVQPGWWSGDASTAAGGTASEPRVADLLKRLENLETQVGLQAKP